MIRLRNENPHLNSLWLQPPIHGRCARLTLAPEMGAGLWSGSDTKCLGKDAGRHHTPALAPDMDRYVNHQHDGFGAGQHEGAHTQEGTFAQVFQLLTPYRYPLVNAAGGVDPRIT